ncbi:MAG: hypothetical protein IPK58_01315 [Acidobacteria bacterium]|nr:hypothetical protein [Acidobacteriota bacterium]
MKIAKIVTSNSHLDYVARVVDSLDVAEPPHGDEFGFAQFVALTVDDSLELVGVIYDTRLINPEYSNFGPRLSPKPDLAHFSPDYLNEQGLLIGILLLGSRDANGRAVQGVPRRAVPAGQDVAAICPDEVLRFPLDEEGEIQMHYYSQIVAHARAFAVPLLEAIIDQLGTQAGEEGRKRLEVLKQSLLWQRTMGGIRL